MCSPIKSRAQKFIISHLIVILSGYLPNSAYDIYFGVLFLHFMIRLKKSRCTRSMISVFSNPQISAPYVSIGKTVLSKSLSCKSMGMSRLFALKNKRCIAFRACSAKCFLALRKLPDLDRMIPKYLYLSVILILCSPMENK